MISSDVIVDHSSATGSYDVTATFVSPMNTLSPEHIAKIAAKQNEKSMAIKAGKVRRAARRGRRCCPYHPGMVPNFTLVASDHAFVGEM